MSLDNKESRMFRLGIVVKAKHNAQGKTHDPLPQSGMPLSRIRDDIRHLSLIHQIVA